MTDELRRLSIVLVIGCGGCGSDPDGTDDAATGSAETSDTSGGADDGGDTGALMASAEDVRTWIGALLASDFLDEDSQADLVQLVPTDATEGYGLGIFRVTAGDVDAFGHNGAVMGFQASALYDPGVTTSVAVMHNQLTVGANGGLDGDPTALAIELLQAVHDAG